MNDRRPEDSSEIKLWDESETSVHLEDELEDPEFDFDCWWASVKRALWFRLLMFCLLWVTVGALAYLIFSMVATKESP